MEARLLSGRPSNEPQKEEVSPKKHRPTRRADTSEQKSRHARSPRSPNATTCLGARSSLLIPRIFSRSSFTMIFADAQFCALHAKSLGLKMKWYMQCEAHRSRRLSQLLRELGCVQSTSQLELARINQLQSFVGAANSPSQGFQTAAACGKGHEPAPGCRVPAAFSQVQCSAATTAAMSSLAAVSLSAAFVWLSGRHRSIAGTSPHATVTAPPPAAWPAMLCSMDGACYVCHVGREGCGR